MAPFGFSSSRGNMKIAGFSTWKVKRSSDDGHYSLGDLKDGSFSIKTLSESSSNRINRAYGFQLEASAKMLCTDKTVCLLMLDHLIDAQLTHHLTFINGDTAKGDWGFSWKFDSSKDLDGIRFIEVKADHRQVLATNLDAIFSAPSDGTPNVTDALYTFAPATRYAAGSTAFETRNTGETSWETLGNYKDTKLVCETKSIMDSQGRSMGYAVEFTAECDMLQASDTETLLLDSLATGNPDFRVTLADGTIFTFNNNIGCDWEFTNKGDTEGVAMIHVKGQGVLTPTAFIACIS